MDKLVLILRLFKYFWKNSRLLKSNKMYMKTEETKIFKTISD